MKEKGVGQVVLTPARQTLSHLVPDQSFLAKGHLWEAVFEYFHGPGFFASYSKMDIARPVILSASGNTPALELRFMLGQPLKGKWEGIANPVLLRDQLTEISYALHYRQFSNFSLEFTKRFSLLAIRIQPKEREKINY